MVWWFFKKCEIAGCASFAGDAGLCATTCKSDITRHLHIKKWQWHFVPHDQSHPLRLRNCSGSVGSCWIHLQQSMHTYWADYRGYWCQSIPKLFHGRPAVLWPAASLAAHVVRVPAAPGPSTSQQPAPLGAGAGWCAARRPGWWPNNCVGCGRS